MARGVELREDEKAVYEGHPSWRALMSFYAIGVLAGIALFVIVGLLIGETALGVLIGGVVVVGTLLVGWFRRISTVYFISNQRLRISRGVVKRSVQDTRLDRVQNVNFSQGVLDRLLQVGTVDFDTAASDDSEFRFDYVNQPEKVVASVNDAIHDHQQRADL
jgi:uncharacterized membrane protein YdbT with pleckstrin-like domain